MKRLLLIIFVTLLQSHFAFCQAIQNNITHVRGPYLGQKTPGIMPEVFARGIVTSKNMAHSPMAISNDGKDIAWYRLGDDSSSKPVCRLYFSRQKEGVWRKPDSLAFKNNETINDLYFSDDNILNCISFNFEPSTGKYSKYHYTFQRTNEGWTNPVRSQKALTGDYERNCIRENYMITGSDKPGGFGWHDLYIKFRNNDGSWNKEINMGKNINTKLNEHYPSFSPDGKYLFFVRGGKYFWVSVKVIEELKPKE